MATKPRTYVTPPSFTPLPYGMLFALADKVITPTDPHWRFGVNYQPICAEGNTTFDDCFAVTGMAVTGAVLNPPGEPASKSPTALVGLRGATPFTVFAEIDCSPVGFWDNAQQFIGDAFTQSEQWQVERAFWTGLAGGQNAVFPHLAANYSIVDEFGVTLQTSATIVSGGITSALDIVEALGLLESELADCYDGVGVIHAPRELLPAMADAHLLVQEGSRYRTVGGNIVVFGAGYPGTSPSGTSASGSVWMYATGAMFIYRSPVFVQPLPRPNGENGEGAFDRANNTVRAIAERTYLLGWDCCHLAVNVSTGGIPGGAPGGGAALVSPG